MYEDVVSRYKAMTLTAGKPGSHLLMLLGIGCSYLPRLEGTRMESLQFEAKDAWLQRHSLRQSTVVMTILNVAWQHTEGCNRFLQNFYLYSVEKHCFTHTLVNTHFRV